MKEKMVCNKAVNTYSLERSLCGDNAAQTLDVAAMATFFMSRPPATFAFLERI